MHRFPRRSIVSLFRLGGARCPYSSAAASSFRSLPRPVEDRGDKTRSPIFASSHCNCSTFYKPFNCGREFSGARYISTASVSDSSNAYDHQTEEPLNPFSLVADELSVVADRLRSMVVAEVPKLAAAAEYYFQERSEGKRFRPTVLLLMATAINLPISTPRLDPPVDTLSMDLRTRQLCIAQITEMIHVASILHDDVLDDADTRRGVGSLNFVMGNKVAVMAGDFLLSRACVALASLKNTEVVTLLARVVEDLVTGEIMQMTTSSDNRFSMEYYMQKTYYKTASMISNSCKAIALLAGQTTEVAMLAYDYGKNMGLAFQLIDDVLDFTGTPDTTGKGSLSDIRHGIITAPILFAIEEFPQLRSLLDNPSNEELVLDYLNKSHGIEKTKELAKKHANLATAAIDSLPETDDKNILKSRRALVELAERVITRTK